MSQSLLETTIDEISELDGVLMEAVRVRQQTLTKPSGALGVLEPLSAQLAGITGTLRPYLRPRTALVCVGDHGVVEEGVSAYPQEVTQQMVANFLNRGAAINVLGRQFDTKVIVVDVGAVADLPDHPNLRKRKVRRGTANMRYVHAMSREQAIAAIEVGIDVANAEIEAGARLLVPGEMGIGNTTSSAAIAAVLTDASVPEVTGPGTGLGLSGWRKKCEVIQQVIELHDPNPENGLDVLAKIGGLEIGAIAGVVLGAAAARVPVVIDGIVSTAGAAIASLLCPLSKQYMIAGHTGAEPGHELLLHFLELSPLLNLRLRLGEGTGAVLALPIIEASISTLNEMATFAEAQVSGKSEND